MTRGASTNPKPKAVATHSAKKKGHVSRAPTRCGCRCLGRARPAAATTAGGESPMAPAATSVASARTGTGRVSTTAAKPHPPTSWAPLAEPSNRPWRLRTVPARRPYGHAHGGVAHRGDHGEHRPQPEPEQGPVRHHHHARGHGEHDVGHEETHAQGGGGQAGVHVPGGIDQHADVQGPRRPPPRRGSTRQRRPRSPTHPWCWARGRAPGISPPARAHDVDRGGGRETGSALHGSE